MNVVTRGNVRSVVGFVAQHLPGVVPFRPMSVPIQGNGLMRVIYAVKRLLNKLVSYTTSVLILAKNLLSAVYVAVGLCIMATVTSIRSVVGARGSRFTKNA